MKFLHDHKAKIATLTLMFYYAVSLPWLTKYTETEMFFMKKMRIPAYALFLMLAFDTVYWSIVRYHEKRPDISYLSAVAGWIADHVLLLVCGIVALGIFLSTSHMQPLIFLVMLTGIADTGFDKHITGIFFVHILFMILTIILFHLGIKEQVTIGRAGTDMVRQSLGYIYPLDFHGHFFFIVLMYIYLKKDSFRIPDYLMINAANLLMFELTNARNDFFMIILASTLAVAVCRNHEKIAGKIRLWLCSAYTVFVTGVPFLLTFLYSRDNAFLHKLNSILSGRLRVAHQVVSETGLHLFGTYLDWVGSGFTGEGMGSDYNWIDFSFVKDTVDYGILFEILFTLGFIYMFYTQIRKKNIYGIIIIAVLLLSSVLEYHTFMPYTYPLTLMMCTAVMTENRDILRLFRKEVRNE